MQYEPDPQNQKHERPSDLRKKNKRLKEGRDALKEKQRQKATDLKKLRGAIDDAKESRDSWKDQCQQTIKKHMELTADVERQSKKLLASEKLIKKQDEQLLQLQQMCDELKKKKT